MVHLVNRVTVQLPPPLHRHSPSRQQGVGDGLLLARQLTKCLVFFLPVAYVEGELVSIVLHLFVMFYIDGLYFWILHQS